MMDIFNCQIVGWAALLVRGSQKISNGLRKAILARNPSSGLIFHSDCGSQHASHKVVKILKARGYLQSMSVKGNCFDNAIMESFFSSLKKELARFETLHIKEKAYRCAFGYIEIFYNRQRRHSALNYETPVEYYIEAAQT